MARTPTEISAHRLPTPKRCVGQRAPSPKYVKTILRHLKPTAGGHYFRPAQQFSRASAGDKKGGKRAHIRSTAAIKGHARFYDKRRLGVATMPCSSQVSSATARKHRPPH